MGRENYQIQQGDLELDIEISGVLALAEEYKETSQQVQNAEEIASNLRLAKKLKAEELEKAQKSLVAEVEKRYESGEIGWRECLEIWGLVNGEDVSEMIDKLEQITPNTPMIRSSNGTGTTFAYISDGSIGLELGYSPARTNVYTHAIHCPEDDNTLRICKDTLVGEDAILTHYETLLDDDYSNFIEAAMLGRAIAKTAMHTPAELEQKLRARLSKAVDSAIATGYRSAVPHLAEAIVHDVTTHRDTAVLDRLLTSPLIEPDSDDFRKLGAALDIAENGANSKYLANKDELTPEEKILLMGTAQHKATNRRKELLENQG